jgi:hypothetical protein
MERKDSFGPDDALDAEDLAECGLQVVRISGNNAAPDIAPPRDLVDLQDLGQEPEGAHDSVEFPVRHFDRDESDDVVPHRREVDLTSAVVQHPGAEQAPDARLRCVARNPQQLGQLADLDAGIADEFQQDLQVGGIEGRQTVTFSYWGSQELRILFNYSTCKSLIGQS